MADIINLNKTRKARDKADARARAVENRVRFGRTKVEKDASNRDAVALERHIDRHKRDQKDD